MGYILYAIVFLYGIVIGSFLNVCIYRIPKGENLVSTRSHCMSCGYQLKWYDLVPLFSWIFLRGKCRKCNTPISKQYPLIEMLNGVLYVIVFWVNDFNLVSVLYCLMTSALIVITVIDWRTYEIPFSLNVFIFGLGIIRLITDYKNWSLYVIGFLAISVVLGIIFKVSNGAAIGGGDVKMMAAAGVLIGWKLIILAFFVGCILGSVIHIARMKFCGAERKLAMGPYLSAGIFISALWGNMFIDMYLKLLGF